MEERGIQMKTIWILEKMENVAKEKPAKTLPHCIAKDGAEPFSPSHPQHQIWKINSRDNGQLQ